MAKEKTRGQKQILEENKSTINFYTTMSIASFSIYLIFMIFVFPDSFTLWPNKIMAVFAGVTFTSCIAVMKYMARPTYSETGSLIDGGIDLNMKEGFAEHLKDLVILTTLVQTLSLTTSYFWLLELLAPIRGMYLFWVNVLGPWFFTPAPEADQEREEKKQRKLDRRMRRMQ